MKLIVFVLCLLAASSSFGQRAVLANDTLSYAGRHYVVGDTIHVAYGTGVNGSFVFVSSGSAMTGVTKMTSSYSKSVVLIDKIYKSMGTLLIRGKIIEGPKNPLGGNKAFIEIEGAVDKKEID